MIATAAINVNADLPINGYTLTTVGKIGFTAITAPVSGSKNLYVSSADNELYWRTNAGTNVKLTSGTTINAALIGGIGGDYTSVSAAVAFDDANDRYTFKQNSATGWARLASGEVRVFETGTSESVYVGFAAPAALAASYTTTWPLAVPSETVQMRMTSAGVVSTERQTLNRFISLASWITQNPGDDTSHGAGWLLEGPVTSSQTPYWYNSTAVGDRNLLVPVEVNEDETLTAVTVYYKKNSNASTTLTFTVHRYSTVGAAPTATFSATEAGNATGDGNKSLTGSAETASSGRQYMLQIVGDTGTPSAADRIYGVKLTYTTPY